MSHDLNAARQELEALNRKIERLKLELAEAKARQGLEPSPPARSADYSSEFTVFQGRRVLREAARRGDWREAVSFGDGGASLAEIAARALAHQQDQAARGVQINTAEAVRHVCMGGRA